MTKVLQTKDFDEIVALLKQGEVVCVFPEGQLTSDGEIQRFRNGIFSSRKTVHIC